MRALLVGEVVLDLSYAAGEGDGQVSSRVVVTEEGLGHCLSSFNIREPGLKDRGEIDILPVDGEGLAVDHDHDDRLSGSVKCHEKVPLASGKIQGSPGKALADHPLSLSDDGNDHINVRSCIDSFLHH